MELEKEIQGGHMEITEIRISLRDDNKLKAFASITLDNCFVIRGLKVIEGAKGTFVAMPSRKRPDGTYQDIAHPINNSTRDWMEEQIVQAFEREVDKVQTESGLEVAEP
ncbi:MAG: septation regulator SpoVG [Bacteroidales bacterium]|nr:septation regulator SpoVG [Candidatus Latescibacterota bacterium]